ncbi:MAG: lanthionine synthetase LanC family protein [Usitatibacter sp.]
MRRALAAIEAIVDDAQKVLGEVAILAVRWRLTKSRDAAERLHRAIERNIPNPVNEALWAAPGTMLGALHMLEWTGDEEWEKLYLANVEQLWSTWLPSANAPCRLWTQDLYGDVVQLLGAAHGFAGNAYAMLRGARLLSSERREALYDRCVETLLATAVLEADGANWPPGVGPPRAGREKMLVQWCHGAPGIVTAMADIPVGRSPALDGMLQQAVTSPGLPDRSPRGTACATAPRAMATRFSSCTSAPATSCGSKGRARSLCTP